LRRVAITGMGSVSPMGRGVPALLQGVREGRSAVRAMPEWDPYLGLACRVGAPAGLEEERRIPRKYRRSMSRMSIFGVQAAEEALADAGVEAGLAASGRLGCVIGSTMGGAESLNEAFEALIPEKDLSKLTAMKFFQCVSHTVAMNVAAYLGLTGVVMATSAACSSAIQALGVGYDLIRLGRQDLVLCGGAEELHATVTGSFDVLSAASSRFNEAPARTPRPFDRDRDGLVCGEGCGVLVLEDRDRARSRGARIHGEVIGYHTGGNGDHVSQSNRATMVACIREALASAGLTPGDIDYLNAHATATLHGDAQEAEAIREVFGDRVPVSSLKGYFGHTLGASGALELIVTLEMMKEGRVYPTHNLETVSPDCLGIRHVTSPETRRIDTVMKNSFAFGGINAVLVCRRGD